MHTNPFSASNSFTPNLWSVPNEQEAPIKLHYENKKTGNEADAEIPGKRSNSFFVGTTFGILIGVGFTLITLKFIGKI